MKHIILFSAVLLLSTATRAQNIITTVAGGGSTLGDGGPATDAQLDLPTWICLDTVGNLYISDHDHYRVRKVNTSGIITTIAGTGVQGFSAATEVATVAQLTGPQGIVMDKHGNLFFSDGYRIKKIDTAGIISTIAGTGTFGYNGDSILATAAEIAAGGLTVDNNGVLYFTDNNRVRKIDTSGIVWTIAGTGMATYNGDNIPATSANTKEPGGIKIDCNHNVIFTEFGDRIRMIDTNGIITTIVGNGTGGYNGDGLSPTSTELWYPEDIAIDCDKRMFISDGQNERVRMVQYGIDTVVTTYAGTGISGFNGDNIPATTAQLQVPGGISVDKYSNLYFVDAYNGRIRYIRNTVFTPIVNKDKIDIQIYPNPACDFVDLRVTANQSQLATAHICDLLGVTRQSFQITTNKTQRIRLTEPPGVYVLTLMVGENKYTERLIVV